jgi:hypothetical protein
MDEIEKQKTNKPVIWIAQVFFIVGLICTMITMSNKYIYFGGVMCGFSCMLIGILIIIGLMIFNNLPNYTKIAINFFPLALIAIMIIYFMSIVVNFQTLFEKQITQNVVPTEYYDYYFWLYATLVFIGFIYYSSKKSDYLSTITLSNYANSLILLFGTIVFIYVNILYTILNYYITDDQFVDTS